LIFIYVFTEQYSPIKAIGSRGYCYRCSIDVPFSRHTSQTGPSVIFGSSVLTGHLRKSISIFGFFLASSPLPLTVRHFRWLFSDSTKSRRYMRPFSPLLPTTHIFSSMALFFFLLLIPSRCVLFASLVEPRPSILSWGTSGPDRRWQGDNLFQFSTRTWFFLFRTWSLGHLSLSSRLPSPFDPFNLTTSARAVVFFLPFLKMSGTIFAFFQLPFCAFLS